MEASDPRAIEDVRTSATPEGSPLDSASDLASPKSAPTDLRPSTREVGPASPGLRFKLRVRIRTSGLETAGRLAIASVALGLSAAVGLFDRFRADPTAAAEARWRWAAAVVTRQLGELKGAFAKAGQFASLRYDVIPEALRGPLATLQDRVPARPLEELRPLLEAELGAPLERHFSSFEASPMGAASIGQVHRARLRDGREVAVKIQYPWVEATLRSDVAWLRRIVVAWARWSGRRRLDVDRFFREFADGLSEEVDFVREAAAAAEIRENLAAETQVVVPEIVPELSRRRVLTMAYYPTVAIHDARGLEARGVDPADLLPILARAYAKQVFVDGLFHADPHPGNLFLIDEPEAARRPRVLFVDFGLHKRLDPELRRGMRQGIYAVLKRDLDGFVEEMKGLGMVAPGAEAEVRAAVARMFDEMKGEGGQANVLGSSGGQILALKDEAKILLEETPGLQLPNDLLLYAKTLSYLFGLGAQLAPEVDLMKVSLPYLLKFLASRD